MGLSVHSLWIPAGALAEELRTSLEPAIRLTFGPDLPAPADYDLLVAGRPEREHLDASPNLRTLVIPWAGLPETTRVLVLDYPHITVHNLHYNALPVGEHAVALLLAAAKCLVPMDRSLRRHDWTPRYQRLPSILLAGKTALILGYGAVGRQIARLCRGLGMKTLAVRRRTAGAKDVAGDTTSPPVTELAELLPRADALFVCLPLTPATTALIGAKELALLPPGAILVNIGRGPIVDEAALYQALCDGTLHAAGLDVWYQYPEDEAARSCNPPSTYPFYELDNVVLSPHRAGHTAESERLRMEHLATLLNAAARDEPLPNLVDLEAGY